MIPVRDGRITLYPGDCLEVMPTLAADSVDSIVTDPPYGLSFMGKDWDHGVPGEPFWREALRVAKPGAHLLAFGGTRMFHRLAVAIEDAGWEIRDTVMWVYGSGFPKSLNVSKAIDKAAGAEREVVGTKLGRPGYSLKNGEAGGVAMEGNVDGSLRNAEAECAITAPATDAARQWDGWGTALKPAWEPVIVARKPLNGTVAANVQQHGTGALNVDGCRVEVDPEDVRSGGFGKGKRPWQTGDVGGNTVRVGSEVGRWPANLIHDGSEEAVELFPTTTSGGGNKSRKGTTANTTCYGVYNSPPPDIREVDTGSAARFFYCAKASRADRNGGLEAARNPHPTVKPTALMRYLCRLVTPPGGVVLDPFMGSGSTGKAAVAEGFRFVGIELEPEYVTIAIKRICHER